MCGIAVDEEEDAALLCTEDTRLLCVEDRVLVCAEEIILLCTDDTALLDTVAAELEITEEIWLDDDELLFEDLLSSPPQATSVKDTAASVANCGIC